MIKEYTSNFHKLGDRKGYISNFHKLGDRSNENLLLKSTLFRYNIVNNNLKQSLYNLHIAKYIYGKI